MFFNVILFIWCVSVTFIFFSKMNSILISLLVLELMMLFSLFFTMVNFWSLNMMELIFFLLILAVSEAVIGLGILTRFMQFYGTDKFCNMLYYLNNILKFKNLFCKNKIAICLFIF